MAFSTSSIAAIKGDTGDQGPAGTNGTDGAAATKAVGTVSTGAAGSSATVTNSGSSSAATFDFSIPQGAAGSVDTATDYTWTNSNRATPVGENDGSFDLDNGQNFTCTPSAAVTLTFTSDTSGSGALSSTQSGQSGFILLDNGGAAKAHQSASTTFHDADFLTTIGGTGKYLISYLCDGTNVYCSTTKALT